jgi:hypothetical protein
MRLSSSRVTALTHRPQQDFPLWDKAGARPSLDLQFADRRDLVDATTGSNLVTFTRQTSGTYVGSDGLIKTATTNLLTYSEDWNSYQAINNADVDVNEVIAPDGTLTGDKIRCTGTTSNTGHVQKLYTPSSATSLEYTDSWYLKQGNTSATFVEIAAAGGTYTFARGKIDWSVTPLVFTDDGKTGGTTPTFHPIEDVGNGWYRVAITITANNSTSISSRIYASDRSSPVVGDYVYAWGAQLGQSTTVGEYIPTTTTINSAPRFDHSPTTGESLGLLVEESRTNLLTNSEDLSGYTLQSVTVPLDSSAINPTGSTGSYKILADSGLSGPQGIRIYDSASSANTVVVSAFVKKSTYRYVYIGFGGISNSFTALFDIEPGLTSNRLLGESGNGTYTNIDAGYQNFPNDWIRIWAVGTTSGTNGPTLGMGPNDTTFNITTWTAAGTEEIYAWGLQYEDDKSFPTSYIPTTGSTATRAADVASIGGSNFSSWFNASQGSIFSDSRIIQSATQTQVAYHFDGANYDISLRQPQVVADQFRANIGNAFTPAPGTGETLSAGTTKAAVAYSGTAGRLQVGSADDNATMAGTSDASQLFIGSLNGATQLNGTLKRLAYWSQRLPNEVLQAITT